MLIVGTATVIALLASFGIGRLDRRITGGRSPARGLSVRVTAFLSVWGITCAALFLWLHTADEPGPPRASEDETARRFQRELPMHVFAAFVFSCISLSICGLSCIGATIGFRREAHRRARRLDVSEGRTPTAVDPETAFDLWIVPALVFVLTWIGYAFVLRSGMMPTA